MNANNGRKTRSPREKVARTKSKTKKRAKKQTSPTITDKFGLHLFNALQNEVYIFDAKTFRYVEVNDAARRNLGYSITALRKLKPWDLKPEISEAKFRKMVQPLLSGKKKKLKFESPHQRKDGSSYPAEVCLELFSGNTTPVFVAKISDISEKQAINEELRKMALVAERTSNAVAIADAKGHLEWVNDAYTKMTGYSLKEIKGKTPGSFLHGAKTDKAVITIIKEAMSCGQGIRTEILNYKKSGKKYWVNLDIQPICNADGNIENYVAIETEITEHKRSQQAVDKLNKQLEEEKERYDLAILGSANGLWDWDIVADTVHYSSRFRELLGYSAEEFPNKLESFGSIVHPDDVERAGEVVANHLKNKTPYDLQYRLKTKGGIYKWFRAKAQALWDDHDNATRMAGSISDITEHKRTEDAIKHLAKTDALTGLPNRMLFHERLKTALTHAKRTDNRVGVMLLDLDHFKNINDTLGHPAGDALLCEVSRRILDCVRETDTVARLGGDEFAIIATHLLEPVDVDRLARRIVESLAKPFNLEGKKVHSGASIGITVYPENSGDSDELLRNADIALYDAKADGRGTYKLYDDDMNEQIQIRRTIEADLRQAMENNDLELFYQPQIEIATMRIIGAEALLRWKHPEKGMIPPSEFIPIAEATRMIIPLGEWVLNTACKQNKKWQDQGLPPTIIAVNVSPLQFKHHDMLDTLRRALKAADINPRWMEIEITEAVAMGKNSVKVLNDLKEVGVQLSIDDFGTGYSSLNRLKDFPVDRLKIDKSFVRSIENELDHCAIGTAIIQLGHSLNLKVIAEGVETPEALEHLNHMGCDDAQGYLFSPALPAKDFAEFLRIHNPKVDMSLLAPQEAKLKATA